jgi:hypothetical protein
MALVKNENRNPVAAVAADGVPRSPFDEKFPTTITTARSLHRPLATLFADDDCYKSPLRSPTPFYIYARRHIRNTNI